ncbi:MAG: ABC transporter permease [Hyphomicrobiales bacterium]
MLFRLEKRGEVSRLMTVFSPAIAVVLTVITGAIIFALLGQPPLQALYTYFLEPLKWLWTQNPDDLWQLEQLCVKAAPLAMIGCGLSVCYLANVWNIGAEGQLTAGAILGGAIPVFFPQWQSPTALILMLVLGMVGGMMLAAIPAFLKNRFNASEILTSLMLVYVAQLLLDWLVRGPWRDPDGHNFPQTVPFADWQAMPVIAGSAIHLGVLLAVIACLALALMMSRALKGFELKVLGAAPRAGRFAGFSKTRATWFCFMLSGALAGLAGICEVMSTVGQLQPSISPGYGFTAIIVAFLGRLNPLGALVAALALALTYLGGEGAQVALGISDKIARVFQGILLFYILACDTLIHYRIQFPFLSSGKAAA